MSYPADTVSALLYSAGELKNPGDPWEALTVAGVTDIVKWDAVAIGRPQPTPAQVQTVLDSPAYQAWATVQADPVLRAKAEAVQLIDDTAGSIARRELWKAVTKAIADASNPATPARTTAQVRQFIKDQLS